MRYSRFTIAILAGVLLLVGSCQQLEEEGPTGSDKIATRVTGTVVRSDDGTPVPLAVVQDVSLSTRRDTTDENGDYELVFQMDPGQTLVTSIFARRDLFGNDTAAVSLRAGADTSITLTLVADSTSPVTNVRSGRPASIVLIGVDVSSISIRGSGVNESALLTYEVRDSLGNPITGEATPDTVRFNIIGGPAGGEYVFPKESRINATTGRVTTRLNSGTKPGVIQVQASARNDSVISSPARITIASGPPDSTNVSISRDKANIPGLIFDNERAIITVIMGDRYQNPVPEGTAVYFTTNMGLVQATGKADADGIASVALISANPRPPGLNGVATITARTIGDTAVRRADSLIQRQITVVFSGATRILAQTTPIILQDSTSYLLRYEVQDQNGNPLAEGTSISVTSDGAAGGELTLTGDTQVTLESTDDTSDTNFEVLVSDNSRGGQSGLFTINIEVTSPNGDAEHVVPGYLQSIGGGGGISSGQTLPKSITLSSITNRILSVKGTGANETSRLTFLVRDSLGNPIGNPLDPSINAKVSFSIKPNGGLGGGEGLSTFQDSTDVNGAVSVTFNAGNKAGVLQVVASTFGNNNEVIQATPVQLTIQGGLPDSTKFIAELSRVNMPGLVRTGPLGTVSIQAGDEFGNPVQTGTAMYFSTSLGLIKASATTGDDGTATASLSGGVSQPTNGQGFVRVQTIDKIGLDVQRLLPFLFTGSPVISGVPADGFAIVDSASYSFNFKVADANNNPLVGGTAITVTVDGPGAQDLKLSGDVSVTLPDTRDTSFTNFSVTAVDPVAGGAAGEVIFRISVSGENGDASRNHRGLLLTSGQSGGAGGVRRIATLELQSSPPASISVKGTGSTSSAKYTFVAKDSTGRTLDASNRAYVRFRLAPSGGLGGGETLNILGDSTNQYGQVSVTFQAGTKAGILELGATGFSPGSADSVVANRVRISVHGGLPDSNLTIATISRVNLPGLAVSGPIGTINIQSGDKDNNPVQPGTAFYFTTSLGIMQASATTDESGRASAQLSGGEFGPSSGIGMITASTIGVDGVSIKKYVDFLFTGPTKVSQAPSSGFVIADSGSYTFSFKVADQNLNPIAGGSEIRVSVEGAGSGDLELTGDVERIMPDTWDTTYSNFTVRAQDKTAGGVFGPVRFVIKVTSQNGNAEYSFAGTQYAEGQLVGPGVIRRVASLELESASATSISIRGTGSRETSTLIFLAKDSLGNPIDETARAYVRFSLAPAGGLGGGEFLSITADSTDDNGRARVTFSSGTKAGVLQVMAKTTAPGRTDTIYSSPVRLTVVGGLPDSNEVFATVSPQNIPGFVKPGPVGTITVQAGDKYRNPVQPGTAFYFTTSHGLIQGSAVTNESGIATSALSGGPTGPANGSGTITLSTVGDGGLSITKTLTFLYTGAPLITGAPASGFTIADSGTYSFTFKVADANGHPLASGSSVQVTTEGTGATDLVLTGNVSRTMPDTRDTNYTNFSVTATDKSLGGASGPVTFRVTVTGPNGEVAYAFSGTQLATGQTGSPTTVRRVASLELESSSATSVSIRGTGATETSTLVFVAKDSLGKAISSTGRAYVVFSLSPAGGLGGGEFLSTTGDSTDDNGKIAVTFSAGTKAGVLQVMAKTARLGSPTDTIYSSPVRLTVVGGLPDSNEVFATVSPQNIPGFVKPGPVGTITVQAGDKYRNPVQPGTAFYFTTSHGLIQGSAVTNESGIATSALSGGPTGPANGSGTITLSTVGDGGLSITKTLTFLYTGAPLITGAPASGFTIADSGTYSFTFKVADANGHPLASGSSVQVTTEGTGATDLVLTGNVSRTMPDTRDTNYTNFSVTATDKSLGGASGPVTFRVTVTGPNGEVAYAFSGTQLATGQTGSPTTVRRVASLELESSSATSVSIRGTGATETSTLVFVAKDSLGKAISSTGRAYVVFSLSPAGGLGGGEFLSTTGDSTDDNGKIAVTFSAGTKAGVLQVMAKTTAPGRVDTIYSSPVKLTVSGGLPDSANIVASISQFNMAGLLKSGPVATVTVQVGDKYKNPVQPGTALYFTTSLGLIQATATTDASGQASVTLSGAGANSPSGSGIVTIQTVGEGGAQITKTVSFLFTGASSIVEAPTDGFTIPDSGTYSFSVKVGDANGNPLVQGSSVIVSVDGPGSGGLVLSGRASNTLGDTGDTTKTRFNVTATDITGDGPSGAVVFTVTVTSENGNISYSWSGTQLAAGQSTASGGGSGYPNSISLLETSIDPTRVLSVKGTGSNESAVLSFIVKDSLGNPITLDKSATVNFTVQGGPGGGEFVFPASAATDASGEVFTTLNAGTIAGVVQVRATTTVGAATIASNPVVFTIAGGLPDSNRITIWTDRQNYPGLVQAGNLLGTVSVQMGDKYGNPVQPNTAIYFSSTGGLITASSFTDAEGRAGASLFGGGAAPVLGQDTITMRTVGEDNTTITKRIAVTFSGSPIVTPTSVSNDSVTIFDGGYFDLDYTVADINGNPLSSGNNISVTVSGTAASGILLAGDASIVTIDTRSTSFTNFRVRILDSTPDGGVSGAFTLKISVSGPNGSTTKNIYGTLGAPQAITPPSPDVKQPAQIAFIGISAADIFVSGVGALENSVITYEVRDSLGFAIEATTRAYATFSLSFYPNSYVPAGTAPRVLPSGDSTDNSGRLRVSVNSGNTAGVIQVTATIILGGKTINSSPVRITVHAGFPDQRHFTMAAPNYNFPGLDRNFVDLPITVQVADKYSNPVQAGTAVYFHTAHGTMETGGGGTDTRGFLTRNLNSANPYPLGADTLQTGEGEGYSYVYSQTLGDSAVTIQDSLLLLWTGRPYIVKTLGPADTTIANGGTAGPYTFTVLDRLGHPMSSGTAVSVTAGGFSVSGHSNVTIPDTFTGGAGITTFTVLVSDGDPAAAVSPPVRAFVTVNVNHPVYGSFPLVLGSLTGP